MVSHPQGKLLEETVDATTASAVLDFFGDNDSQPGRAAVTSIPEVSQLEQKKKHQKHKHHKSHHGEETPSAVKKPKLQSSENIFNLLYSVMFEFKRMGTANQMIAMQEMTSLLFYLVILHWTPAVTGDARLRRRN